jgi:hypothetical protein
VKLKIVICAIPLFALLGCGSDNGTFTLSTGTYALSNTAVAASDNCNISFANGGPYKDGVTIQLTVSGSNVTFAFGPVNPDRNPVSSIQGNTIGTGTKTFNVDDRPPPSSYDCYEAITETVRDGSIMANDQFQATFVYGSDKLMGYPNTQCTPQYTGYKVPLPCASTMSFQAKKQ